MSTNRYDFFGSIGKEQKRPPFRFSSHKNLFLTHQNPTLSSSPMASNEVASVNLAFCDPENLAVDDGVNRVEIVCASIVKEDENKKVKFIHSRLFNSKTTDAKQVTKWPPENPYYCWHCCEYYTYDENDSESKYPVPMPTAYDPRRNVYTICGIFCSFSCLKGYLIGRVTFSVTDKLNWVHKMAREVFGITGPIRPAEPQLRLKKFGGDLDLDAFHASTTTATFIREPPFVTQAMIFEATTDIKKSRYWQITGLRRPEKPIEPPSTQRIQQAESLYEQFLKERKSNPKPGAELENIVNGDSVPVNRKRRRPRKRLRIQQNNDDDDDPDIPIQRKPVTRSRTKPKRNLLTFLANRRLKK